MSAAPGRPKQARAAARSAQARTLAAPGRPKQARAAGHSPQARDFADSCTDLPPRASAARMALAAFLGLALAGCASRPASIISTPMTAIMPPPAAIERPVNGAIFQAGSHTGSLFSLDRSKGLGDLVKVQISEKLVAASKANSDTSRETSFTAKGPGANGTTGTLAKILDMDADASGSNKFKGSGTAGAESSFDGQLMATIINVMPNGNLLLAGERIVAFGGNQTGLRFAGVIDPRDVKYGNTVSSNDVGNARIEIIAAGEVSEASNRRWIQKVLSNAFTIW